MNSQYVPSFGYQEGNELGDDDIRERNGLKPKPRMKSLDDPAVRQNSYLTSDADWITFDETTCTSPDQISIAPGYLDREWTENGRRCFHYAMDKPILDFYATLSARYAVERTDYNGVKLEIYYHPDHKFALPSMLQASKDGLDYFGKNFSPYLYRQYRIIEFPRYQGFAQAFPNTIPYSEGIGFLYRKEDRRRQGRSRVLRHRARARAPVVGAPSRRRQRPGLDDVLRGTRRILGADGAGEAVRRGGDAEIPAPRARRLSPRPRHGAKEGGAAAVRREPAVHPLSERDRSCFYALRDYIGESAMNTALRAFLDKWALKGPPYPTSRDLYSEFDKVTPDSLKYVLRDLFEDMTFYDNKADSATTTKRPDGTWNVHLVLRAKKMKGDSVGNTRDVPVADYMDVGVFGDHVAGQKLGEPLLVKKVHITQNVTTLDLVVPKEPKRAGIDPYNKLIDRTPEDNAIAVTRR